MPVPLTKGAAVVYEELRAQILDNRIDPGTVLQQIELAEKFGVSRTPVRHALQQLAYDGLVEFLPGQTARVVSTSLRDALEIRQLRMWLEVPALLLALRSNPEPVMLFQILDQVEALGGDPTPHACSRLLALDEEFHRWLLHESGNHMLETIAGRMRDQMFRGQSFSVVQDYRPVRNNLLALGEAVRSNDMARIRQLMIEHMTDTGTLTMEPIGFGDVGRV